MKHRLVNWNPYEGSSSILLALVLLIIIGILLYFAFRLRRPGEIKRPGKFPGLLIIIMWLLSIMTFVIASTVYVRVLLQQVGPFIPPANPITPVTLTCAIVTFPVIAYLARRSGFWGAFVSAIVGTIAAPLIFELPFDLIVMWHTFPPNPAPLFTLLYFLPLFLIEISSFALLTFSPAIKLSKYTLFLLAAMFLIFALWALFGFAYPASPLPTAFNMVSKVVAFAVAISLFWSEEKMQKEVVESSSLA